MKTRKILLLGLGNSHIRFAVPPHNPENYIREVPGYEVVTFGYNEGVDIKIEPGDDFDRVLERLPAGWVPDYCFMQNLMGNMLPKGIENAPFPTIYLAMDWDWYIHLARTNSQSVDLEIVGGEYARKNVDALGANNSAIFYDCGIMREYFPDPPKKIKDRKYDIFYTFQNYGDSNSFDKKRHEWIIKICELSAKYKYNILIVPHISHYRDYLSLLENSKMALSYNRDGHLSYRVLEAGSQGTVIMDSGDQINKYFIADEEFIPVTEDNFCEKVERYLEDEDALQEMSDRFYSKVKKEFESRVHFRKLIELSEGLLKGKKGVKKYSLLSPQEKFIRRGEVYYIVHFRGVRDGYFLNQGNKFLDLSMREFESAIAIERTPRAMTDMAIVRASTLSDGEGRDIIKESVSILNDVISSYPQYAVAYFNLGLAYFKLSSKEEAITAFETALAKFRDKDSIVDPWCLYNREYEYKPFAFHVGKSIDTILLMLSRGEEADAGDKIRKLYQAACLHYIYLIEESNGNIFKGLKALFEAHVLQPESNLIAKNAARKYALFGYKDESLAMYHRVIDMLPLNIDLRLEYIKLLFLYRMDTDAMSLIKDTLQITKIVSSLTDKTFELKNIMGGIGRFSTSGYSHDSCMEGMLNGWAEQLYVCLRENPDSINIVLRIVQIWDELGRVDKIFEIIDEYSLKFLNENTAEANLHSIKEIYNYLEKVSSESGRFYREKLNMLNERISGLQKAGIPD